MFVYFEWFRIVYTHETNSFAPARKPPSQPETIEFADWVDRCFMTPESDSLDMLRVVSYIRKSMQIQQKMHAVSYLTLESHLRVFSTFADVHPEICQQTTSYV